jgi:hypothetical protein
MSDLLKPAREAAHADLAYYRKMTMSNPSNTTAPIDTSRERVDADLPTLPEPMWPQGGRERAYKDAWSKRQVEEYAAAAVAAERERCARIADQHATRDYPWGSENTYIYHAQAHWAERIAAAIRGSIK